MELQPGTLQRYFKLVETCAIFPLFHMTGIITIMKMMCCDNGDNERYHGTLNNLKYCGGGDNMESQKSCLEFKEVEF